MPATPTTPSTDETKINTTKLTSMEMSSMESRQLHSGQKEAMKKIPEFSGDNNELDVDEWLFDLTNLFSLMKLNDETKILETMGKLTGPALRWYQENLTSFTNWNNAEQGLQNRFKELTPNSQLMKEFFLMQQEENQSVTFFYEQVIRKYKKVRKLVTEQQVITVLQNGVKNLLKTHLIRNEKSITKHDEWLQIAREEEHIQSQIQRPHNDSYSTTTTTQPYFEQTLSTATINKQPTQTQFREQQHRPVKHNRNTYNYQHKTKDLKQNKCLICNRQNHLTNQCFYKKETGCFKCGQSNHQLRNCPTRHFFE